MNVILDPNNINIAIYAGISWSIYFLISIDKIILDCPIINPHCSDCPNSCDDRHSDVRQLAGKREIPHQLHPWYHHRHRHYHHNHYIHHHIHINQDQGHRCHKIVITMTITITGFDSEGFSYFLTTQMRQTSPSPYHSKLVRMKLWQTHTLTDTDRHRQILTDTERLWQTTVRHCQTLWTSPSTNQSKLISRKQTLSRSDSHGQTLRDSDRHL